MRQPDLSRYPDACRTCGFSLLEVLASLALLALLLTGVYAGIHTASHSVQIGESSIERLDQIRSAQEFLRRELMEATALPWALDTERNPVVFSGSTNAMSYVAPMPGYLGKLGPQLQTLKLVPDAEDNLQLEASFAMVPPDGSKLRSLGSPEVLLTGIRHGRFSYYFRDGEEKSSAWLSTWKTKSQLPTMVRIELTMKDGRIVWPYLEVPIRQGPNAINLRAVTMPLFYRWQP